MSVEFCGGTHLTNAKEAEDFVLIEESGIAKVIRRIVGYTRAGAAAARARAADLLGRLTELEAMPAGPELLAKSKVRRRGESMAPSHRHSLLRMHSHPTPPPDCIPCMICVTIS